jgi:cytochrome c oxidase cbb3-type subunit 3
MSEPQNDKLLDHNYDGIQELDNPLPDWWVSLFYLSMIFAAVYLVYFYGFAKPAGVRAENQVQQMLHPEQTKKVVGGTFSVAGQNTEAVTEAPAEPVFNHDEDTLASGKKIFDTKCVTCHGPHAGGLVGPNLTDKYWIHGKGSEKDIYAVVTNGVPDKGMIAWNTMMSDEDIRNVVVYVRSLQGSNPADPKPPQGDLVE